MIDTQLHKDRIAAFIKTKGKKICGLCEHWKADGSDLDRDHAKQGRARCDVDKRIDRPFLYYSNPACDNKIKVSAAVADKRLKYFEGK